MNIISAQWFSKIFKQVIAVAYGNKIVSQDLFSVNRRARAHTRNLFKGCPYKLVLTCFSFSLLYITTRMVKICIASVRKQLLFLRQLSKL